MLNMKNYRISKDAIIVSNKIPFSVRNAKLRHEPLYVMPYMETVSFYNAELFQNKIKTNEVRAEKLMSAKFDIFKDDLKCNSLYLDEILDRGYYSKNFIYALELSGFDEKLCEFDACNLCKIGLHSSMNKGFSQNRDKWNMLSYGINDIIRIHKRGFSDLFNKSDEIIFTKLKNIVEDVTDLHISYFHNAKELPKL